MGNEWAGVDDENAEQRFHVLRLQDDKQQRECAHDHERKMEHSGANLVEITVAQVVDGADDIECDDKKQRDDVVSIELLILEQGLKLRNL